MIVSSLTVSVRPDQVREHLVGSLLYDLFSERCEGREYPSLLADTSIKITEISVTLPPPPAAHAALPSISETSEGVGNTDALFIVLKPRDCVTMISNLKAGTNVLSHEPRSKFSARALLAA
jgi:hypothetical protein